MKSATKPCFLLFCLVFGIYMMRNADTSLGNVLKYPLRLLAEYRPTQELCTATTLKEAFSQGQIDRAQGFKESLQGMRGGNPLKDMLKQGKTNDVVNAYAIPLIPFIAPWIVMLVISCLGTVTLCCNWCCIYGCCKKAKCCKCCKAPKDANRKRIYIAVSAFLLLGTFGTGIAGIVVSSQVPTGMELTLCSFLKVIENLEYGVPQDDWLGVKPITGSLDGILTGLTGVETALTASSGSLVDVNNKFTDIETQLTNSYNTLNVGANKNLPRVDPDRSPNLYTPEYIQNLGPYATPNTYFKAIHQECQARKDIINSARPAVNNAIGTIKGPPGLRTPIEAAKTQITGFSDALQGVLKTLGDFGGLSKDVIKGIGMGLTGIFIANLVLAVFGLASIVMVGFLKVKFFNKFIHLNWCVTLLLTILGWILAILFYPLSVVMMEACDVLDSSLKDRATLNDFMNPISPDVGGILEVCLLLDKDATGQSASNGDLSQKFKLDDALGDFNNIFKQFDDVKTTMGITSFASADPPPPSLTIPPQSTRAVNTQLGKVPDGPETVTDLTALNGAVNRASTSCTTLYDAWQLHSDNCNYGHKFINANPDAYNKGSPTCIGFDIWAARTIGNRYTAPDFGGACGGHGHPYVTSFITNFQTNRGTVNTIFTNVKTELDAIQLKYDDFATKIKVILNEFGSIETQMATIDDYLKGADKGILKNLNCKWVGNGMRDLTDSMCVGFIASVYQSSIVIIITSCFTLFGAISMFCLAKRFLIEDDKKAKPV